MNIERFAYLYGGTTTSDVQAHIHAGLRSAPTTKTYKRFFERKLAELQDKRDETLARYNEALARGDFERPKQPSLLEKAARDDAIGEAARRVIEKRRARLAACEKSVSK